jgi:PPOX class probable F420-dependent enzyme
MPTITDDLARLIEGVHFGHIATVLPDGAPHTVPVWIDREGDRIAVLTSPRSRKARNLARDPRVALSIIDQAQPYVTALVRGRVVEILDGDPAWEIIDRISRKYTGEPYQPRTDRVVLLIEPEHAQAISFA